MNNSPKVSEAMSQKWLNLGIWDCQHQLKNPRKPLRLAFSRIESGRVRGIGRSIIECPSYQVTITSLHHILASSQILTDCTLSWLWVLGHEDEPQEMCSPQVLSFIPMCFHPVMGSHHCQTSLIHHLENTPSLVSTFSTSIASPNIPLMSSCHLNTVWS